MTRRDDLIDKVGEILLAYWDPIGVRDIPQAADEYDEYASHVARMLSEGASRAEVSNYLLEIERETLGLQGDPARASEVADKLLSLTSSD